MTCLRTASGACSAEKPHQCLCIPFVTSLYFTSCMCGVIVWGRLELREHYPTGRCLADALEHHVSNAEVSGSPLPLSTTLFEGPS